MPSVASELESLSFLKDFSTALAGVDHIILVAVLVEQRLGVAARRVHGGRGRYVRARL
jgi:hypothetical protein